MLEPYPLILQPSYKDYLWGGTRLKELYQKTQTPDVCAESWEFSDRSEGLSFIENGPLKGQSLQDVLKSHSEEFFGKKMNKLPILCKLIDAQKPLSIQVHPSESSCHLPSIEPKTEAWHILDAKPDSYIYLGFKRSMTQPEIVEAIEGHTLEKFLNKIFVKPGETYFIPAGMIHSIGPGCLIYEVQQNSNTTYRLYDWGRKDTNGKQRELHLSEALACLKDQQAQKINPKLLESSQNYQHYQHLQSSFFCINEWILSKNSEIQPTSYSRLFFVKKGRIEIHSNTKVWILEKGQSCLIPPFFQFEIKVSNRNQSHIHVVSTQLA